MYQRLLLFILAALFFIGCNAEKPGGNHNNDTRTGREIAPTHLLEIHSENQERIVAQVKVALAQTEAERNVGLMDVHNLPFDSGLYFIFETEAQRSFWMANTPLSLDILFINSEKRIVRIHTNTTPFSERQIRSELPAMYTLEVNAGFVREFDIREGMHVTLDQLDETGSRH